MKGGQDARRPAPSLSDVGPLLPVPTATQTLADEHETAENCTLT
jgi:hypothetical protein